MRTCAIAIALWLCCFALGQDAPATIHAVIIPATDTVPPIPDGYSGHLRSKIYLFSDEPVLVSGFRIAYTDDLLLPTQRVYYRNPAWQVALQSTYPEDRGFVFYTYTSPVMITATPMYVADVLWVRGQGLADPGDYDILVSPLYLSPDRPPYLFPPGTWVEKWRPAQPFTYPAYLPVDGEFCITVVE